MRTTSSLRTTSAVALVSVGWIVACGESFSSAGEGSDGGSDAGSDAASNGDTGSQFCANMTGLSFCDDFDDRSSGSGAWTSQNISPGASIAFDGTSSMSPPHSILMKATAGQNAVYGYNVTLGSKLVVDFSIKIEKIAVATDMARLVSITTKQDANTFRLDLVKTASNAYELRASAGGEALGEPLLLNGMAAIESGWHKITWTTKSPVFAPVFASGTSAVKLDGTSLGERSIEFSTVQAKALVDALKSGLRLNVGVVVPPGESQVEVRYDNVTVSGS